MTLLPGSGCGPFAIVEHETLRKPRADLGVPAHLRADCEAVRFKAVMLPFHINLKIAATSFLGDELSARPGQHQSHVIGLFGATRPIQYGGDDALGELGERQAAVFAQKFQQTRLAKFAKLIFRLSDAVAIRHQQIAGAKLDGAFVVADLLEETDHGSAGVELAESAVFANEQWRQMAG